MQPPLYVLRIFEENYLYQCSYDHNTLEILGLRIFSILDGVIVELTTHLMLAAPARTEEIFYFVCEILKDLRLAGSL